MDRELTPPNERQRFSQEQSVMLKQCSAKKDRSEWRETWT